MLCFHEALLGKSLSFEGLQFLENGGLALALSLSVLLVIIWIVRIVFLETEIWLVPQMGQESRLLGRD